MAIPKEHEIYSWQDYLSWDEGERFELFEGTAWAMSPAPSRFHQELLMEFSRQFSNYLVDKPCRVYAAPFDVKLSADDLDYAPTVFQPDLAVCCDEEKLTDQGMTGAPDFVLEILSPSTGIRDRREKFDTYCKYGVGEYWIADPEHGVLEIFQLKGGKYERIGAYNEKDKVSPALFPDLAIDLSMVFKG